jgi:hypothetical protein
MAGGIYRKKKESNYVVLDKHCLQNTSLSWAAKGLHSYLMGLPDDWKVTVSDLKNRSKDGRDATSSAMQSLIQAGYVVRESEHDKAGRFAGYNYYVFETPEQASEFLSTSTVSGLTVYGFSENGKTENGKSGTTKYYNNQITNKLTEEETRESDFSQFEEKPLLAKDSGPAAAAPQTPAPHPFQSFDIDRAAESLTADPLCIDRFGRTLACSPETAAAKHPAAVIEFVADQKAVGYTYNNDRDFRSHYFNWLPLRVAKKRAEAQKQVQVSANTTFIPKNIPVFR